MANPALTELVAGEPVTLPSEMTDAIREVLGMPNFQTGPLAHGFRAAGFDIRPKMEDEQAFILFWLLRLAIIHGPEWRQAAASVLGEVKAAIPVTEGTR